MPRKLDHPLRLARQRAEVTQSGLARDIGVSRGAITAIEEGRNRMPRAATRQAIEARLGMEEGSLRAELLTWLAAEEDVQLTTRARATLALPAKHIAHHASFTAWRSEIVDTPTGFASLLRINVGVVTQYEQGDRKHGMSDRLAGALLNVLGISEEYLAALQALPTGAR